MTNTIPIPIKEEFRHLIYEAIVNRNMAISEVKSLFNLALKEFLEDEK